MLCKLFSLCKALTANIDLRFTMARNICRWWFVVRESVALEVITWYERLVKNQVATITATFEKMTTISLEIYHNNISIDGLSKGPIIKHLSTVPTVVNGNRSASDTTWGCGTTWSRVRSLFTIFHFDSTDDFLRSIFI